MSVEVEIPQIGESIKTVFIARWRKQPGEAVVEGETLVDIDSDKASLEVPSPAGGVVVELLAGEGDEVEVGAVVARIDETAEVPHRGADATPAESAGAKGPQTGPAARQVAAELGVDIGKVTGSGTRGRVLTRDVEAAAGAPPAVTAPPAVSPTPAPVTRAPVTDHGNRTERVPMSPLRRTIARRLVEAQQNAAMLTTFNEVDMSAVMELRARFQDRFVARYGIKLGFMSFFVKAAIEALKAYPAVNAEIDGNDIVYKRFWNVGVAVSTDRGLVVPVIRDADRLSFAGTEQAIADLATRARDGKLLPDDFEGGTFTITNGGVFGSLMSTPILNPPQVGILGMHSIQSRPVDRDGQIVLRPMMYLAVSYDHRIIDGRTAVSFLVKIKELIEEPERILIEV